MSFQRQRELANADATCAMVALALSDTELGGSNFAARPALITFCAARRAKRIPPGPGWSFWLARNERARSIDLGVIVDLAQGASFT